MNRWMWFCVCAFLGLLMLAFGLLVPIHLRAVDAAVVQRAGLNSPGVIEHGLNLVRDRKLGAAELLLQAAPENLRDREKLVAAVDNISARQPSLLLSGGDTSPRLSKLYADDSTPPHTNFESLTEFVIRLENRDAVMAYVNTSQDPVVQELLRCRAITNTVIFAPSTSDSGQAFDAAICVTGLLLTENRLSPRMHDALLTLATGANHGAGSEALEQSLANMMSLGQRMNWGQLAAFTAHIDDPETLRLLTEEARLEGTLPVLFASVELSEKPGFIAHYVMDHSKTGLADLRSSLQYGGTGVAELARRDLRLSQSSNFSREVASAPVIHSYYEFALHCARWTPGLAFVLKWLCYLTSGFFLAAAMHFAQPAPTELELPMQVRSVHLAREALFSFGFLLFIVLLNEPFLGQENQSMEFPLHIHLPSMGNAVSAQFIHKHPTFMNQISLLTLVLFFVLQALLYLGSVTKLAEIRRQQVSPRIKLRLLENEDHLFDAGLYLGFVGTIISLILVSLHVIEPSLMAGYSSTSFGIIFVSIFKIFQLRPERRRLVLQAEAEAAATPQPPTSLPAGTPAMASTP